MAPHSFVAIDVETTGLDPALDRIIEVAAIRYELGVETARMNQLIDPGVPVPVRISNLTGILPAMVNGKPTFAQVATNLKDLIGDLPIVAHNAKFDLAFVQAAFARQSIHLPNPVYDTAELARVALPRAKNHRLATLVRDLQISLERHHRAEDDAEACGQVFLALLKALKTMDLGLLRFILNVGEPGNWTLAPLFRAEHDTREAAGEKASSIMQWIKPFNGQLHGGDVDATDGEPEPIRPVEIAEILGPGGVIAEAFPAYEHRPQQLEMADSVTRAFNRGSHLLIEAGTGTGKSLAYLVPAIVWAIRNGEKVAISTHTINLQEQLWEKDIPFLTDALQGTELEEFSAALVKGRPNYVCLRKWEEEAIGANFLTTTDDRSFHIRMASWLSETETGDKSELNLSGEDERTWQTVMSETETCLGPKCKWYRNHCFAYRARREAKDADLLVLNHAVLFSYMQHGTQLLPPFRHVILDEAHHIEDVATQNLGINLENWDVTSALLYQFRAAGMGFLPLLKRRIPGGQRIPSRPPIGLPADDHLEKLIDLTFAARTASDELFRLCAQLVESKSTAEEDAGGARAIRLTPTVRWGPLWEAIDVARGNAVSRLRQLSQGLLGLGEALEALEPPMRELDGVLVDIQKQSGILNQSAKAIDGVLLEPTVEDVTWIEATTRRDHLRVTLRSAPINVGKVLQKQLFDKQRSVVLTSATLSVNGGFDHLKQRLGLDELGTDRLMSGLVSSPFNYKEQTLLCVPEDLPSPKEREFTPAVTTFLREYLVRVGGRTLVLFTSHKQLRQVYHSLKGDLEAEGIFLLGQGLDGSRGRIVEDFKTLEKAVLFGSASFWEGVDIPGEGLTTVILVKLPFMPPGDPVMEARTEDLEARGYSSFAHLSLPQAVIKFKQGFGRLIRTRADRGVVIVLDNRVSGRQTRYGPQFIRSLPGPATCLGSSQTVMNRAIAWLKQEGLSEDSGKD
jgi:ATP-dependent DNA helicase DinG